MKPEIILLIIVIISTFNFTVKNKRLNKTIVIVSVFLLVFNFCWNSVINYQNHSRKINSLKFELSELMIQKQKYHQYISTISKINEKNINKSKQFLGSILIETTSHQISLTLDMLITMKQEELIQIENQTFLNKLFFDT